MIRNMFLRAVSLAILVAALSFVSCGGGTVAPADDTGAATEPPVAESPSMTIAEKGHTEYTVIYPVRPADEVVLAASHIEEAVKKVTGLSGSISGNTIMKPLKDETAVRYEIIVGKTNRPESEDAAAHLEEGTCVMKAYGSCIVILGETDRMTRLCADRFVEEYFKGGDIVTVPEDLDRKFECADAFTYAEYENPMFDDANDPWVVRHGDDYYYCWSGGGVFVKKINNLDEIENKNGKRVWYPEPDTAHSHELWAPELHYLRGEWYIYVACDDGNNPTHRMYVLKGTSQDPTQPFTFVGQITDPSDKWAIDGTVLQYRNEMYFVWSGWEGDSNGTQQLYIAHMSDPCTIDSERVLLSRPELSWERVTMAIQEGPVAVVTDDACAIVYSASASWKNGYCLGQLLLTGDDPMDPASWVKSKKALLSSGNGIYGPGHCSFTTALDGQMWVVYHGNTESGSGWKGRKLLAQPVVFGKNGLEQTEPQRTVQIPSKSIQIKQEIVK